MPSGSFTSNAVVTDGAGVSHYRDRDHIGFESDENIELDGAVGPYAEGADLHTVLVDLIALATT